MFVFFVGDARSEYLPTAFFIEEVDKLFDSFNSVKRGAAGKPLRSPLSDNSPHIGHWTKASMGIKSWIFLKDGKRAFKKLTPSQNGWITAIAAVQHVWRTLRSPVFHYLETRSLNQDPLENTFGVIRLHCGSNNNPTVGQFVDALKTSIINGLVYKGLRNANCEGDDTELFDNLHSLLKESISSQPNPSTSHGTETIHDGLSGSHIAEQMQQEANDVGVDLSAVAYVSGFIAKHVLRAVRCEDCKTCLTSSVMLPTHTFIYFKEYRDNKQSLTSPSKELEETVEASVTLLEGMMAEVAHTYSVGEKITAAIKNTVDFGWIQSSGCLLHHQEIVDGIARIITRIFIPWWCKRRNRSMMEESRQRSRKRKMKILSHT